MEPDNVKIRGAIRQQPLLIYLHGMAKGRYLAVWPDFPRAAVRAFSKKWCRDFDLWLDAVLDRIDDPGSEGYK